MTLYWSKHIMKTSDGQIKVLIADRDESNRSAIKLLLINENKNIVITETASMSTVLSQADYDRFNLIIIDWEFDGHGTKSLIHHLHQAQPNISIIVLSKHLEDKAVALEVGAQEFIYKGDPPGSLYHKLLPYLNLVPCKQTI
ncbi:MAG: response regulator [Anaerolineales bacterium]|nr:MAG: response regulator [Anaerolineales bacterium]